MTGTMIQTRSLTALLQHLGSPSNQGDEEANPLEPARVDRAVVTSTMRKFLPSVVQRDLTSGGAPPRAGQAPTPAPFRGAVLFADASGFTALTEKLATRADGAEKLCETLNVYFGAILRLAAEMGGDVISFSGDAVTILWAARGDGDGDGDEEATLGGCVRAAARCALAMHDELRKPALADCPCVRGVFLFQIPHLPKDPFAESAYERRSHAMGRSARARDTGGGTRPDWCVNVT